MTFSQSPNSGSETCAHDLDLDAYCGDCDEIGLTTAEAKRPPESIEPSLLCGCAAPVLDTGYCSNCGRKAPGPRRAFAHPRFPGQRAPLPMQSDEPELWARMTGAEREAYRAGYLDAVISLTDRYHVTPKSEGEEAARAS